MNSITMRPNRNVSNMLIYKNISVKQKHYRPDFVLTVHFLRLQKKV